MADIQVSGRMEVGTLKKQFKEEFGSTLRVYKGTYQGANSIYPQAKCWLVAMCNNSSL